MPDRAYALLHIKAIDEDSRQITGIATTPTPDRVGDIIEPLGVKFRNPLPLLLYHDQRSAVGTVRLDKPTADGITFTAQIPKIAESGRLQERVDEAWQSVKTKLIRGVSIGFRVLNDAMDFMKDTGGIRYRETEILELSLVAVPANQDATIQAIKAFDLSRPAAPGTAGMVSPHQSGAADTSRRTTTMHNSEKLTACRANLTAKTQRIAEIQKGVDDEALSDALKTESAQLLMDAKDLRAEIERLEFLEAAAIEKAQPVIATNTQQATETREGRVQVKPLELPPGIEFARLMICKVMARISNGDVSALQVAKARYPDNPRIQMELKAAVAGATTTDATWAGPLVYPTTLVAEFVDYLRPLTIVGKFGTGNIPSLRRIPFNVRILGQTSGTTAGWVGQGKLKKVQAYDIAVNTIMTPAKIAAIAVFSDEIGRYSNPSIDMMIRDELARAIIERMDTDFIDPTVAVVANVSPASITNGLVALTPSGTDAAAVRADLAQLLQTFIDANNPPASAVLITSNTVALAISLMTNALGQAEFPNLTMLGGTLRGIPCIASQYCAVGSPVSNLLILVNAGDIFLADDGAVSIDVSREASLEMSDAPEDEAGTVVSMFQSNQIALRAERYINWAKRRASAAAYLADVAYTSGSPS